MKFVKKIFDLCLYIGLGIFKDWSTPKDHKAIFWLRLSKQTDEVFVEVYSSLNQLSKQIIEYAVPKTQKHFDLFIFKNLISLLMVTRIPAGKKVIVIKLPIHMFFKILWQRDNLEHSDIYQELMILSRYGTVLIRPRIF